MFTEQDVSIVIPAFNICERLGRLLISLENQIPDPTKFEVLVVDDGSTDGTKSMLGEYSGKIVLKPVFHEVNRGRSAARNAGIAKASREIILFLDGDTVAPVDLVTYHASMHNDLRKAFVGGVRYVEEFGANGFTRYLETRGVMRKNSSSEILPRYFLSGHSSVKKIDAESVGGFDESIEYGEDMDFGLRLASIGVSIVGIPQCCVIHQHVRTLSDTALVTYQFGRKSLPVICRKHPEMKKDLNLQKFESRTLVSILTRICFTRPFFTAVSLFASIFSEVRLPSFVYSYILYRSYAVGYLDAIQDRN